MANCIILGAGKIARGFIGHLLFLSGHSITFIEKSAELVNLLNQNKQYTLTVLGNKQANCVITGFNAISIDDEEHAAKAIETADLIFTAMGGKNLEYAAPILYKGLSQRFTHPNAKPITIITCENWKNPATLLRKKIEELADDAEKNCFTSLLGVTEAVIMRSAIEPDKNQLLQDPLTVNVQDFWDLPVDASRIKGTLPAIRCLRLIDDFGGFLDKKFYTYNAANGTTSYLGSLLGYIYIADAVRDPFILEILTQVYQETSQALSKKLNLPLEDLRTFGESSLKKLRDRNIVDYIERNARDPLRKLGSEDRLVAPARMCEEFGVAPTGLATAIAAALHYQNDDDPAALDLKRQIHTKGSAFVLETVCKLPSGTPLHTLVLEKEAFLQTNRFIL